MFANQSSMQSTTPDNNLQFLSWYSIPAFRLKASIKAVSCKTCKRKKINNLNQIKIYLNVTGGELILTLEQ